jgi:hypothetical protein
MSTESEKIKPVEPEQLTEEKKQESINHLKNTYKEPLTEDEKKNIRTKFPTYFKNKGKEKGKEGKEEEGKEEEGKEEEGKEEEDKKFETMGDLLAILMYGAIKGYALAKVTLLESVFNATIMPVLVTGGADEDSIITILSFLKNPNITPEEIVEILNKQHEKEKNDLAKLGKSGAIIALTTTAFGQTALRTLNPQFDAVMDKLNLAMNIIKDKIKIQNMKENAGNMVDGDVTGVVTASKIGIEPEKGGASSKKINKTKVKQRIHNSIKKFHKTNNLKTLKREIHRMMRRFTRGAKK